MILKRLMQNYRCIFILLLLFNFSNAFAQNYLNLIPVDSAGYYRMMSDEGQFISSNWKGFDEVKYNSKKGIILGKKGNNWSFLDDQLNAYHHKLYTNIAYQKEFIVAQQGIGIDLYSYELELLHEFDDALDLLTFSQFEKQSGFSWKFNSAYIIKTLDGLTFLEEDFNAIASIEADNLLQHGNNFIYKKGDGYGIIFNDFKVVQPDYTSIKAEKNGFFSGINKAGKEVLWSSTGNQYPISDSTYILTNYGNWVKIFQQGEAQFYNEKGEKITHPKGEDVFILSNYGLNETPKNEEIFFAIKKNGKVGLYDSQRMILPHEYENILRGQENQYIVEKNGKYGVVSHNNQWIIQPEYGYIDLIGKHYRIINRYRQGVCSIDGDTLIPRIYGRIGEINTGIIVQDGKKFGFYTHACKKLLPAEYTEVKRTNFDTNYLEFSNSSRQVLVSKNSILTPFNTLRFTFSAEYVKYSTANATVICEIKDGKKVDSTIYPPSSIVSIKSRDKGVGINISQPEGFLFLDQSTGKFGVKARFNKGYLLTPKFDNAYNDYLFEYAPIKGNNVIKIAGKSIFIAQALNFFNAETGYDFQKLYKGLLKNRLNANWHSTSLDPVFNPDNSVRFISSNTYFFDNNFPLILNRRKNRIAVLVEGELNWENGDPVCTYMDLVNDLNFFKNVAITDNFQEILSDDTLYVKSPKWEVIRIEEESKSSRLGPYNSYVELPGNFAIFSRDNEGYGILGPGDSVLVSRAGKIDPVYIEEFIYFKVLESKELRDGTSEYFLNLYDAGGRMFEGEYSSIEPLTPYFFKVTNRYQQTSIINHKEEVLYTFSN